MFSARSPSIAEAFSKAPSQPTCPFCNPRNSNSSSICKLRVLSGLMFRRLCWRAPTRSSNKEFLLHSRWSGFNVGGPCPLPATRCLRVIVVNESHQGVIDMQVATIGLDITKNVFQVHAIDGEGEGR